MCPRKFLPPAPAEAPWPWPLAWKPARSDRRYPPARAARRSPPRSHRSYGRPRDDAGGFDHVPGEHLRHAPALAAQDLQLGPQDLHMLELLAGEGIRGHDM